MRCGRLRSRAWRRRHGLGRRVGCVRCGLMGGRVPGHRWRRPLHSGRRIYSSSWSGGRQRRWAGNRRAGRRSASVRCGRRRAPGRRRRFLHCGLFRHYPVRTCGALSHRSPVPLLNQFAVLSQAWEVDVLRNAALPLSPMDASAPLPRRGSPAIRTDRHFLGQNHGLVPPQLVNAVPAGRCQLCRSALRGFMADVTQ